MIPSSLEKKSRYPRVSNNNKYKIKTRNITVKNNKFSSKVAAVLV